MGSWEGQGGGHLFTRGADLGMQEAYSKTNQLSMLSRQEATSGRIESSQQKKLQAQDARSHGLRQIRPAKTGFLFCPCR